MTEKQLTEINGALGRVAMSLFALDFILFLLLIPLFGILSFYGSLI